MESLIPSGSDLPTNVSAENKSGAALPCTCLFTSLGSFSSDCSINHRRWTGRDYHIPLCIWSESRYLHLSRSLRKKRVFSGAATRHAWDGGG